MLVGVVATGCRIIGQLLIPAGEQTVLEPSAFAENGTMPLAFTIYGVLAYSLIGGLFLLVRDRLPGGKLAQGLKFALAYSLIWIVYLLEPLPHVAPLDRITYLLADSLALVMMGLVVGALFGRSSKAKNQPIVKKPNAALDVIIVAAIFSLGRLAQYFVFNIYSLVETQLVETLIWTAVTGLVSGGVMVWLSQYIKQRTPLVDALVVGGLLFGLNLLLFNFFMPLVFKADLPDLLLRTGVDILAVTTGWWLAKAQIVRYLG